MTKSVRARYLVGADGANSTVRQLLGFEREDFDYRDGWLSVDVERRGVLGPRFMYGTSHMIADPGNVIVIVPAGTKRLRLEFQVDPDADNSHLLDEEIGYQYLAQRLGLTRDQVEIVRLTIYPFAGLLCHQWREGSVFLAGDAAHLMPPFLGEGAASGMRDAANLAWKLDLVLRGVAGPDLLDSYEVERYPHARANVVDSIALGRIVTERDPVKAAETSALLLSDEAPAPPPDPILSTGVLLQDRDGAPTLLAGELAPQGWVHLDGVTALFDDVAGPGFHLVARDADPLACLDDAQRAFLAEIHGRGVNVCTAARPGAALDVNWTYERYFDKHAIAAFIMRPDFYLFGTVASLAELPAAVNALREQLHHGGASPAGDLPAIDPVAHERRSTDAPSKELAHARAWQHELAARTTDAPSVAAARAAATEMMRRRSGNALPTDITVEAVAASGVAAEWINPPVEAGGRVILYLHGGGTLGGPEDVRELLARITRRAQSRALSLDYRMSPGPPFSAGVEDVLAAYRWLLAQGTDPREVALAGESASANLALCAALALRDAGEPLPGAVALLSPLLALGSQYPGDVPGTDPGVSPLLADLAGLPPLILQVGTAEAQLDDSRQLADRVREAGVDISYEEYPDMIHRWHGFPYLLDALRATRRLGDVLLQKIGPGNVPTPYPSPIGDPVEI